MTPIGRGHRQVAPRFGRQRGHNDCVNKTQYESHEWLAPFVERLREAGRVVIELGCGPGLDAKVLAARGFRVFGCDLRREPPHGLTYFVADLRDNLPLRDRAADVVLASLSLHYFPWAITRDLFGEIHRALKVDGRLLFRVNATDDPGAGDGVEVEPRLRQIGSWLKRYFDEADVRAAVDGYFVIEQLRHTTARYEGLKNVWECLARRL